MAARFGEFEEFGRQDAYAEAPVVGALEKTGWQPLSARSIDVNTGDDCRPEYGSRPVVRQLAKTKVDDASTAMPPLGA